MTTRRENLRMVLKGEQPQWVPFSPNFYQWFNHHKAFGSLPDELAHCKNYLDAMKAFDCDLFSRNGSSSVREIDLSLVPQVMNEPAATGMRQITEYETPHGTLQSIIQAQDAISASHVETYFVKDWERDGKAFLDLLDQKAYRWDEQNYLALDHRVGDDGIVNVSCGSSPLKMLHNQFGLDHTCLFVLDYPEVARQLCDMYWAKLRPVIEQLAAHPKVESVILMDNVDTPFYPPALVKTFWAPYVRDAATLLRENGKPLFVHACGKLKTLAPIFAECGIAGLEGISHPPLGDWTAAEAQACHERFIFNGGFSAHEQESMTDAQVCEFFADYLPRANQSRFIFSSSCQTSINTTWSRLLLVRDLCRQWGGMPQKGLLL